MLSTKTRITRISLIKSPCTNTSGANWCVSIKKKRFANKPSLNPCDKFHQDSNVGINSRTDSSIISLLCRAFCGGISS